MFSSNTQKASKFVYLWCFYLLGIVGLFTYRFDLPISANAIFELLLLTLVLISISSFEKKLFIIWSILAVYVLSNLTYIVIQGSYGHIADVFLAYKAYIYLLFIPFILNKELFEVGDVEWLLKFLLVIFLLKYSFSVLLQIDDRPIIFHENNYELMFLSLLVLLAHIKGVKLNINWILLISLIFILSGSRSAIVLISIVFLYMYGKKMNPVKLFGFLALGLVLSFAIIYIFESRLEGKSIEDIDRFRFFMAFLYETKDWSFLDFLIGADRITPMSNYTCNTFYYYQQLFSYANDGQCYSVILHSFLSRIIFDHGLLGLLFLLTFVHYSLISAGYSRSQSIVFLSIVFLNGLSVSSFNSIFYMLALVLFLNMRNENLNAKSN